MSVNGGMKMKIQRRYKAIIGISFLISFLLTSVAMASREGGRELCTTPTGIGTLCSNRMIIKDRRARFTSNMDTSFSALNPYRIKFNMTQLKSKVSRGGPIYLHYFIYDAVGNEQIYVNDDYYGFPMEDAEDDPLYFWQNVITGYYPGRAPYEHLTILNADPMLGACSLWAPCTQYQQVSQMKIR
jgi:hypothetical protein